MGILSEKKLVALIVLFALVFISLFSFFQDIKDKDTLDADSVAYIETYVTKYQTYNIASLSNQSVADSKNTDLVSKENNTGFFSNNDILGVTNYISTQWAKISSVAILIYNLPTFILSLTPLPMDAMNHFANVIVYGLLVGFIFLLRRFWSSG